MIPITPATVLLIVQGMQAAVQAAPAVAKLVEQAKQLITTLFKSGLISKELQDSIHQHVDEVCAAALAGNEPPQWTVEPDPV